MKLTLAWCLVTCSLAGYVLLKPSPRATELPLMPTFWGEWLDYAVDFRTFIMTVLVGLGVAVFLAPRGFDRLRRRWILIVTSLLLVFELLQVFIPSRSVHPADLLYTVAGGFALELISKLLQRVGRPSSPASETESSPPVAS